MISYVEPKKKNEKQKKKTLNAQKQRVGVGK
jgi:hypothetical protein